MNSAGSKIPGSPLGSTGSINRAKSLYADNFNVLQATSSIPFNGGSSLTSSIVVLRNLCTCRIPRH